MMNNEIICLSQWVVQDWVPREEAGLKMLWLGGLYTQSLFFDYRFYANFIYSLTESEYLEHMIKNGTEPLKVSDLDVHDFHMNIRGDFGHIFGHLQFYSDRYKDVTEYVNFLLANGCFFKTLE